MSHATCCWCKSPLVQMEGVWWCGHPTSEACRRRQASLAMAQCNPKTKKQLGWLYVPTPKQCEFHERTRQVRRVLYGGQAGPGKSHAIRWGLYRDCLLIPNLNCLLLRRTFQQLEQTHLGEMVREQKLLGATYTSGDKVMRFSNGSLIRAGHCENVADAQNYLSTEYDRIAFDELVTFDQGPSLEIMSRARTSKANVKANGDAQVWCGSNPGGRGAMWVKALFIDKEVDRHEFPSYDPARYGFVSASLDDNPYISEHYRRDLEDLPEMRKRQLLYGDWSAFEGQFFSEWRPELDGKPWHVQRLDPTHLRECEVFGSLDWGYNSPGCMLWWVALPDGALHIIREYKFKQMTAEMVGKQLHDQTRALGLRLRKIACDPAMWQKTGAGKGESIAETLLRMRLPMQKSDNDRFLGWLRLHELLRPMSAERPWLTIDPSCTYLIRTLPAMVSDDNDPDDLDTTQDDHAVDSARYGAMSRPSPTRLTVEKAPGPGTWGHATAAHDLNRSSGVLA